MANPKDPKDGKENPKEVQVSAEPQGDPNVIPPAEAHDEEEENEHEVRKYRKARRKARDAAGEIKELNITAMMDMMTIILVFLIKSYTASSTSVQQTDSLQIPHSTTQTAPKDNINVVVTASELLVNDKSVAPIVNGTIPAAHRDNQDSESPMITSLFDKLSLEVEKQKKIAQYNKAQPFLGHLNIVADKRIPYSTVLAILYTAGQAELGTYKLMAQKND